RVRLRRRLDIDFARHDGHRDSLDARAGPELLARVADVRADRLGRQDEPPGDLLAGQAAREHREYLALPRAEDPRATAVAARSRVRLERAGEVGVPQLDHRRDRADAPLALVLDGRVANKRGEERPAAAAQPSRLL